MRLASYEGMETLTFGKKQDMTEFNTVPLLLYNSPISILSFDNCEKQTTFTAVCNAPRVRKRRIQLRDAGEGKNITCIFHTIQPESKRVSLQTHHNAKECFLTASSLLDKKHIMRNKETPKITLVTTLQQ